LGHGAFDAETLIDRGPSTTLSSRRNKSGEQLTIIIVKEKNKKMSKMEMLNDDLIDDVDSSVMTFEPASPWLLEKMIP
jgi:hypothetical protein